MIQRWRRVLLKIFLEDFETLPEEKLLSLAKELGTNIKFNPCTDPNRDIEFYDDTNNTIMNFLRKLEKEGRIEILNVLYKENGKEVKTKQETKGLTPVQKLVVKVFNIPYK